MIQPHALAKLLIEKGDITAAEFPARIAEERATSRESHCDSLRREGWMNLQITYDLRNAEKALPARVRKSFEEPWGALP